MSYRLARSSSAKASRVGKSSTVVGAEMFFWIIRIPHERWNMRRENGTLLARHLVVVQLHRVNLPAAEFIVLGVGAKDGTEQNTSASAFGMDGHFRVSAPKHRI